MNVWVIVDLSLIEEYEQKFNVPSHKVFWWIFSNSETKTALKEMSARRIWTEEKIEMKKKEKKLACMDANFT